MTARRTSALAWWATNELCESGAAAAIPDIEKSMPQLYSGPRGRDKIAWCKARMEVIARNPDRITALGSVFASYMSLPNTEDGLRLMSWAINELSEMDSPRADSELDAISAHLKEALKLNRSLTQVAETDRRLDLLRMLKLPR